MNNRAVPRYIAVEGPIGVGKTSLAKRLAQTFNYEILLEGAEENPFLERFYHNPRQHALATQLFFLFQRARQLQELRQDDMFTPVRVADFLIEKDRLFARQNLDADEYQLYEDVYRHLTLDAPRPDLVIYLQAPVEVLITRSAASPPNSSSNATTCSASWMPTPAFSTTMTTPRSWW